MNVKGKISGGGVIKKSFFRAVPEGEPSIPPPPPMTAVLAVNIGNIVYICTQF